MSKTVSLLSALLCTFIWGTTFIAQDTGMDDIPVSCAINVVPQMNVHNNALNSETVFDICFRLLTYKQNFYLNFLLIHY